jgi:hypothetical protein
VAERSVLSSVTIVGMRFYAGAHEYLHKAGQHQDVFDQCLFFVPVVDNMFDVNSVMLHNGKKKLGSVEAKDAARIKRLLDEWRIENPTHIEDVIVVRMDYLHNQGLADFKYRGSITVRGMYRINERFARKFANKHLKD